MKFRAEEIALFLNGEIIGDQNASVSMISKMKRDTRQSFFFVQP